MDRRRKNPKLFNIFLAVLCVAVFAGLVGFLLWNRQQVARETVRLEELAQEQQDQERARRQGSEAARSDGETGEDGTAGTADTGTSEAGAPLSESDTGTSEAGGTPSETEAGRSEAGEIPSETDPGAAEASGGDAAEETESGTESGGNATETGVQASVLGISCWGDEFYETQAADQYSYRAALQRILNENGYEMTVADKTLEGAGTLSMMKMAGVPQMDLDAYIAEHQNSGTSQAVTETGIRDLTAEEMDRWERDYIPVLMMGYYGGWNNDIQELIEQQQKILDTFGENKENFIIAGIPPLDKTVGTEEYHAAMEAAWGEHYVNTTQATSYSQSSKEGQEEIARAIYERLLELGYIGDAAG